MDLLFDNFPNNAQQKYENEKQQDELNNKVFSQNDFNSIDYSSMYFEAGDLCLSYSAHQSPPPPVSISYDYGINSKNVHRSSSVPVNLTYFTSDEDEDAFHLSNKSNGLDLVAINQQHSSVNITPTWSPLIENKESQIDAYAENRRTSSQNSTVSEAAIKPLDNKPANNKKIRPKKNSSQMKEEENDQLYEKNLSNHLSIDFKPIIQNFHCMIYTCLKKSCGMEANTKQEIIQHLNMAHNCQLAEDLDEASLNQHSRLSFKCLFSNAKNQTIACGKKLENLNKLANHIRKDHSATPSLDLSYFHMCSYENCLWLFENENSLKLHKLKHKFDSNMIGDLSEKKKYSCTHCSSTFQRPSHLKDHLKLHENQNESRFKCSNCDERFISQALLISHLSQKHKGAEKLYKCQYEGCGKSYTCQMYLSSHITKSHSQLGIKELNKICLLCNKKFEHAWQKRQHDQLVHQNLLIKCTYPQCTKTFRTKNNLRRHMKIHDRDLHKKFKCEHENCAAEFLRHEHLVTHVESHKNEKKFVCAYAHCDSTFKYRTNLITHKKVHQSMPQTTSCCSSSSSSTCSSSSSTCSRSSSSSPANKEFIILNLNQNNAQTNAANLNKGVKKIIKLNLISCNYCNLKFDSNESLNVHMKNHYENIFLKDNLGIDKLNSLMLNGTARDSSHETKLTTSSGQIFVYNIVSNSSANNLATQTASPASASYRFNAADSTKHSLSSSMHSVDVNNKSWTQQEQHVINISSENDEESGISSVVLDNLSGSARTDYKFNHVYIEKYALRKRKMNLDLSQSDSGNKKFKQTDDYEDNMADDLSPAKSSASSHRISDLFSNSDSNSPASASFILSPNMHSGSEHNNTNSNNTNSSQMRVSIMSNSNQNNLV